MDTRAWKNWFIVELYKEIPPLFSLILKMLETWSFFRPSFNFQSQGVKCQKGSFYTNKSIVFIII